MEAAERDAIRAEVVAELEPQLKKAQLLDSIDADPKFRTPLRTMVAQKFPETAPTMPETAVAAAVQPTLDALNATKAELDRRLEADTQARQRYAFRQSLINAGVKPADLAEAEDIAQKRMILDPEAIALTLRESRRVAAPTAGWGRPQLPGQGKGGVKFWGGETTGSPSIAEDHDAWARARAAKDWDDLHNGRPLDPIDA